MSTALAERPVAPLVTPDELDLVKRTVANGASDAELKLYLYDCQRQGVHPLDRLLHFTKRGGKYTPVTSIDLMRTRAADTGEYAGSDDVVFVATGSLGGPPDSASVTVWRLVQGVRCAFSATARWSEYYPGDQGGHMWRKMPHTMLGKCAEALALRKGFPRQLAGLYAREEMDQAGESQGYSVTPQPAALTAQEAVSREAVVKVHAGFEATKHGEEIPQDGKLYVARVDTTPTKNKNVTKSLITFSDGTQASTIRQPLAALAEECCQERAAVSYTFKESRWGRDLLTLERADRLTLDEVSAFARHPDEPPPFTDEDIAF